jgi:antibiotic biosynthesis monooxygenase (ABM) superfamily enzyme
VLALYPVGFLQTLWLIVARLNTGILLPSLPPFAATLLLAAFGLALMPYFALPSMQRLSLDRNHSVAEPLWAVR